MAVFTECMLVWSFFYLLSPIRLLLIDEVNIDRRKQLKDTKPVRLKTNHEFVRSTVPTQHRTLLKHPTTFNQER